MPAIPVVLSSPANYRRSRDAICLPRAGANRLSRKKKCTAGAAPLHEMPHHRRKRLRPEVSTDLASAPAPQIKKTSRIRTVLEMIKFEHSVFALPFALTGALLAARATHQPPHGWPTLHQIVWIVVAMVAARSAAMTINRIADLRYDRENPRTQQRALATGAAFRLLRVDFHADRHRAFLRRRVAAESARAETGAGGARDSVLLFLHQALHELVALVSRLCAGNFSRGRVDRHHRRTRPAHADPLRRGHAVGRRLRRALRVPGHRLRPPRRPVFRAEAIRHRQRIADRARRCTSALWFCSRGWP